MLGKVVVTAKSLAECAPALEYMSYAGCQVEVRGLPQPWQEDALIGLARDADALVFAMEPVTAKLIAAAPRLKVIGRPGVGYDTVDLEAATARGIRVTVAAGCNDQSVADFTLGLMLMASRRIAEAAASVQRGGWERPVGAELWTKTLAVFGLGRIGKGVAQRARGFDMRVLAVSEDQDAEFAARHGVSFVSAEQALREADVVSLHLPLTPQTRSLVNADFLAAMKRGSFLINTARGPLVDEAALAAAVQGGQLAGAAVDVLCQQGAGSTSPLIGVPGIIVTPHMATLSRESMERVAMSTARSVVAVLRGQPVEHLANPEVLRGVMA